MGKSLNLAMLGGSERESRDTRHLQNTQLRFREGPLSCSSTCCTQPLCHRRGEPPPSPHTPSSSLDLRVLYLSTPHPSQSAAPLLLSDLQSFSAMSPCCERLSLVVFLTIVSGEYLRESREGEEERDTRDSCLPRLLGLRVPDLNLNTGASTLLGATVLAVVRPLAEPTNGCGFRCLLLFLVSFSNKWYQSHGLARRRRQLSKDFVSKGTVEFLRSGHAVSISVSFPFSSLRSAALLLLSDLRSFSATPPCCERLSLVVFLTIVSGEYFRESREGEEERDTRDSCLPRLLGLRVPDLNLNTGASTLLDTIVLVVVHPPAEPTRGGRNTVWH
ncbi:hypothetical protein M9H77_12679 [Catharanthus roseus]|uniref:Uncharacterized protein n=1 Tax=Catharanthus roseus TaxID=4058 RepID=A0ACC0BI58_CATRO|nr:hypothetical protein M9H77_12679 [Catharanthus roseus]